MQDIWCLWCNWGMTEFHKHYMRVLLASWRLYRNGWGIRDTHYTKWAERWFVRVSTWGHGSKQTSEWHRNMPKYSHQLQWEQPPSPRLEHHLLCIHQNSGAHRRDWHSWSGDSKNGSWIPYLPINLDRPQVSSYDSNWCIKSIDTLLKMQFRSMSTWSERGYILRHAENLAKLECVEMARMGWPHQFRVRLASWNLTLEYVCCVDPSMFLCLVSHLLWRMSGVFWRWMLGCQGLRYRYLHTSFSTQETQHDT